MARRRKGESYGPRTAPASTFGQRPQGRTGHAAAPAGRRRRVQLRGRRSHGAALGRCRGHGDRLGQPPGRRPGHHRSVRPVHGGASARLLQRDGHGRGPHPGSQRHRHNRRHAPPPARVALLPARQLELPSPGTWLFDPPHTAIRFIAKHVGMAHVHGRFTRFTGGIRVAPDMRDSQVSVRIDAASITTGNRTRDNHLRSADFLDVEHYPYIDFVSTRFVYQGGSKWTLHGTLTMHGTSRSVGLDTTYLGTVNGGYEQELRCAALAKTELHREDFTLNWRSMLARGIAVVGPTVQLELDVQAMYRTAETPTPPE
nr:YceI family protein [Actinospica acidiphila]